MNENASRVSKLFIMLLVLGFFMVPGAVAETGIIDATVNASPILSDHAASDTTFLGKIANLGGQLYVLLADLGFAGDEPADETIYIIPVEKIYVGVNDTANVTEPIAVAVAINTTNSTSFGGGAVAEPVDAIETAQAVPPNEAGNLANQTAPNATGVEDVRLEIESVPATEEEPVLTAEEQAAYDAMMDEINRKEAASEASEPEDDPATRIAQEESAPATHAEAVEEAEREVTSSSPVTYVTENNVTRAEIGNGGGVTTEQAARDAATIAASLGAKIEVASQEDAKPRLPDNSTSQVEANAETIVASQSSGFSGQSGHQPVCLGSCGKGVSARTQAAAATNIAAVSSAFT